MNPGHHDLETLAAEIERIVAERQELRASGADAEALEQNRRMLTGANALYSRLLIRRYLSQAA